MRVSERKKQIDRERRGRCRLRCRRPSLSLTIFNASRGAFIFFLFLSLFLQKKTRFSPRVLVCDLWSARGHPAHNKGNRPSVFFLLSRTLLLDSGELSFDNPEEARFIGLVLSFGEAVLVARSIRSVQIVLPRLGGSCLASRHCVRRGKERGGGRRR